MSDSDSADLRAGSWSPVEQPQWPPPRPRRSRNRQCDDPRPVPIPLTNTRSRPFRPSSSHGRAWPADQPAARSWRDQLQGFRSPSRPQGAHHGRQFRDGASRRHCLCAQGSDVAINYLPPEQSDADDVAKLIRAEGRRAVLISGDLKDEVANGSWRTPSVSSAGSTFSSTAPPASSRANDSRHLQRRLRRDLQDQCLRHVLADQGGCLPHGARVDDHQHRFGQRL